MSKLWYNEPAKVWEEAIPLGNGKLGAMIFGGMVKERIQLNEDSVWYGGPMDRNNPDAKDNLGKIRELILGGEISKAEKLMKYALSGMPQSERTYQSLGDLHMNFELEEDSKEEYVRSLSLDEGIYNSSFKVANTIYEREAFISAPNNVLVMHFTSKGSGKINFDALLTRERFYDYVKKVDDNGIILGGNLGKGGSDFSMVLKASCKGGRVKVIGEHLIIEDADEATLYFTAGTTFRIKNLQNEMEATIDKAMALSYNKLKENHIEDYQGLYKRVEFKLEGSGYFDSIPTNQRLKNLSNNYSEGDYIANNEKHNIDYTNLNKDSCKALNLDTGLSELIFNYGRYLLIASSRPGSLPATLQGIWNKDMKPSWDSKYTININTEMNYWQAEKCNLSECHLPLFELIKRMVPNGRKTAKEMYGCRGFVAHHNTDIWADTSVQEHWIPGSYWVMGAAWLCTHLWAHYEYNQDEEFLKEALPIMRESAVFFLDFLIEDKGYLKTCPSVSPENTFILPNGEKGSNTIGVTMDNQILRDLFSQCIRAADILGIDDEINQEIKDAVERLIPTRIGKHGQIMEWEEDYEEAEPGHRHISHLYAIHPSDQITMDKTPELADAARTTLERRLSQGGGHTGWSRAWIINLYAKLWDGERAYENLQALLAQSTLPNMFNSHPPFQIDGNFGATSAIADMLVQSNSERIIILPALAKVWNSGSIKGLCVKGGAEVSVSWKNGKLTDCIIYATNDIIREIGYKGKSYTIDLKKGHKENITEHLL